MKKLNLNFKKIFEKLKLRHREEIIKEVAEQITTSITSTVLNERKFSSQEMAFIVNTVKGNVTVFLSARKGNLSNELEDCKTALINLKQ